MSLRNQSTLASPVSFEGKGLHLGEPVRVTLHPAGVDHGLSFTSGAEEIAVGLKTIGDRPLRTALEGKQASVETVEHLLSGVVGCGITNLKIEIEGPEPPATDGSARPFCEAIETAGLVDQEKPYESFRVDESFVVEDQGGGKITALPHKGGLKVTYILSGDGLPSQCVEYEHSPQAYKETIRSARTFCREFEVEDLKKMKGVGDGADESNTLVVKLSSLDEDQRMANELAYHKILDLIGDLSLLGKDLEAHLICHRSGHACNHELLRAIRRESGEVTLNINVIKEILPHAYPFLLVDRIIDFEENKYVVGLKNVTINEPFFSGHFPDEPIMPGVLLIEALAQTGAAFIHWHSQERGKKLILFTGADKVKFRHRVVPGDQVLMKLTVVRMKAQMGMVKAVATVRGAMACEAELKFMIVEKGD